MHAVILRTVTVAAMLSLAGLAQGYRAMQPESHDKQLGKADIVAEDAARDLSHTVVTPTLDAPIKEGESLVWCSTFQLAWNELGAEMGGPLEVTGEAAGVSLAGLLNRSGVSKGDLDEASYVALAGGPEVLVRIKQELHNKFDGAASPHMLPESMSPGQILAYAYLFKSLQFETPFIRRPTELMFDGVPLAAFGLWGGLKNDDRAKMLAQISVLKYESDSVFTVELKTQSAEDRLIIARVVPGMTLGATIDNVAKTMNPEKPEHFGGDDALIVPVMNFDVTRAMSELVGAGVRGTKNAGVIDSAKQNIRFRLDEKGAILKSEAAISITSAMPVRPKRMVCDGPFVVLLQRRDAAYPYFAMWVDNPELLTRFQKK